MATARSLQTKLLQLSAFSNRTKTCRVANLPGVLATGQGNNCLQCSQVSRNFSINRNASSMFANSTSSILSVPMARFQQREYHLEVLSPKVVFKKMAEKIGFKGSMRFKKRLLQRSGVRMYLCAVELVEYEQFFTELQLPDTFNSWFRITELHIWMCLVQLASEDREGIFVRNNLLKNMWDDVERRTKRLGELASSTGRREGIYLLNEELRANIYSYDEGILSNDKVLAGAVWRSFFEMQCDDPEKLEKMVSYIRKQLSHLETQSTERVLETGILTFLPFNGEEVNQERTKVILAEILKRS